MRGDLVLPPGNQVHDFGVKVEMFENPNLARFLRRAQQFLGREEYQNAIKLLQDVVEGRTMETLGSPGEGANQDQLSQAILDEDADASEAVYAGDGRLYRPVRRLCQELLAALPGLGLELYRQTFEVEAERLFAEAMARRDLHRLEEVYNRFFVTLSAGRAMAAAADLQMDAGRYRSAIQILQDMLDIYPPESRRRVGISDLYLRVRILLCFSMLGEHRRADEVLEELLQANPDASMRLMGEIVPVGELRKTFVRPLITEVADDGEFLALRSGKEKLVPLWESRFRSPEPYRVARSSGTRTDFLRGIPTGSSGRGVPRTGDNKPGTSVRFLGESVMFMDHYCLRVHHALSGALIQTGEERLAEAPLRRATQLQSRIPLYDFGALRVETDESRYYSVVTPRASGGVPAILNNHLVAYDRSTMEPLWDSDKWVPGPGEDAGPGYRDVTFLATPTVFGNRLLAPVLHLGAYGLQCVDRQTGRPLWRTRVHTAGSVFLRAPGTQVRVQDGNAYFLTNGGALAAIDAYTGDLRWIRKYERLHPLRRRFGAVGRRPTATRNRVALSGRQTLLEHALDGFVTSDMVLVDGLVVIAPSDGRVLLCVDGASGEPVWMLSRDSRYEFYGTLKYLIGANSGNLYMASEEHVLCLDLRNGTRRWSARLPEGNGSRWRGRGLVTEELVILPADKGLLVHRASGDGDWWTLPLPSFSPGREPLQGESNLFLSGPYLAVAYEGGVEVYSSDVALQELADAAENSGEEARYLAQAGELIGAIDVLDSWLLADPDAADRARSSARMLSLSRELALARAADGSREQALDLLERCRRHCAQRDLRQRWHLARIEVFRLLQDLESVEHEQQILYRFMDGKG
jgi:outer membrane protein assembly factor BamB